MYSVTSSYKYSLLRIRTPVRVQYCTIYYLLTSTTLLLGWLQYLMIVELSHPHLSNKVNLESSFGGVEQSSLSARSHYAFHLHFSLPVSTFICLFSLTLFLCPSLFLFLYKLIFLYFLFLSFYIYFFIFSLSVYFISIFIHLYLSLSCISFSLKFMSLQRRVVFPHLKFFFRSNSYLFIVSHCLFLSLLKNGPFLASFFLNFRLFN